MDENGIPGPPLRAIVTEPVGYDIDPVRESRLKSLVGAVVRAMIPAFDKRAPFDGPTLAVVPGRWNGEPAVALAVIVPDDEVPDGVMDQLDSAFRPDGPTRSAATLPVAILLGEFQEMAFRADGEGESTVTVLNPNHFGTS